MKKRTRIILPIVVILTMLVSMFGMALPVAALVPAGVGPAAGHGIGMAVSATGPTGEAVALEGDTVNVTIIVYSLDNSGDGQNITSIVDIVHHNSGSNSSGNLLSSPVVLYPFGDSVTVWYTYVVEAGDNDPLNDDAAANSTDTVTGLHYTGTGQGQVDVVHPCIHIEKTTNGGDGLDIPWGAPVTWTYNVTNCGDVPLSNITVTDSHAGVTPAYVSGDNGDSILQTSETWIYQASGNAIEGEYNNTGYIDGYYGTTLVQADDASSYFGINPCIHIEKTTNGGDGLNIPMGDPVTWTYNVTNCGNVPLSNITVTDSHAGVTPAYVSGDNGDSILQTSETWIYQASGFAVAGAYNNTGHVDGYYGTTQVQADDASSYFGTNPLIDLEKYVNGDDADSPTGPVVPVGSTVTFTFNVTNTGNIALTNVVVTDNVLGSIGTIPSLAVGASQTLTTTAPALAGQHTNVGNVTSAEGATDSDAGNYFGAIYTIDLEKYVNGDDADSPTGPVVPVGSTVTFTFNVTNTGNIALTTVVVNDNVLGYIGTIPSLAVGASQTLTTTAPALAGQHTNVGNVTSAEGATDSDAGNYFGAIYTIDLEKYVNGDDADSPTGPVVPVGSTVTFTFNVTNTGNIALTTVVVNDNVLGYIGTIPSLAAGSSQTLTKTASALAGQHTDVGNVTTNEGATDSDAGNYFGAIYTIDLEKYVNGDDADSPTGPVVLVGSTVTFTFNVTNTGNIALTNVVVTDNVLGSIGTIPSLAVGASQTLTKTASALAGQHTDVGNVTTNEGATDSDAGNYFGAIYTIDLEKYVNGDDADSPTGPVVPVGSTVTFTFNVTNTGNIALTNVVVTDNVLGSIGTIPSLAVGASQTLTKTASALAGQHTDVGNVTTNEGATDSDPGNYFGAIYTIDLEKYVNGDDADSPTGPVVLVGSTVTFTFNVTNTGNIALTNVVVTDNVLGNIGTIPSLAVGASQTLTKTASALAGQHTDVGNVTTNEGATDSDPGNYFGQSQQCTGCLKICKFEDKNGNGQKDSCESWLSGWTFNVTDSQGNSQLVTTGRASGSCGSCGSCDYCVTICGLAPGNYTVTEIPQAGWICTTGNPRTVTVVCNQTTTVSFGNQKPSPGCIKIYKFNDKNGNGKKDWNESYLSNWVFTVTDSQGHSWSGTTGFGGYVTISNLAPGAYTIKETLKAGWICTTANPLNNVTVVSGQTQTVYFGNKQQCGGCC